MPCPAGFVVNLGIGGKVLVHAGNLISGKFADDLSFWLYHITSIFLILPTFWGLWP